MRQSREQKKLRVFDAQCPCKEWGAIYWMIDAQLMAIAGPYSALQKKVNHSDSASQSWKTSIPGPLTWNQDGSEHARKASAQQDFLHHSKELVQPFPFLAENDLNNKDKPHNTSN